MQQSNISWMNWLYNISVATQINKPWTVKYCQKFAPILSLWLAADCHYWDEAETKSENFFVSEYFKWAHSKL